MFPPCSAQFRLIYPTGTSNRSVYRVIRRIVESGCNDFAARSIMPHFANPPSDRPDNFPLVGGAIHNLQTPRPLRTVIEGIKPPDFVESTHAVKSIEIMRVARRELAGLEI